MSSKYPTTTLEASSRHVFTSLRENQTPPWEFLDRYSSLSRLVRIIAVCKCAAQRFRLSPSKLVSGPLTPLELEQSRQFWIRQVQQSHFPHEIRILEKRGRLLKSSSLIRLTPFLDEVGLIRVGSRLQNANVAFDIKHPYILPK